MSLDYCSSCGINQSSLEKYLRIFFTDFKCKVFKIAFTYLWDLPLWLVIMEAQLKSNTRKTLAEKVWLFCHVCISAPLLNRCTQVGFFFSSRTTKFLRTESKGDNWTLKYFQYSTFYLSFFHTGLDSEENFHMNRKEIENQTPTEACWPNILFFFQFPIC